MRSDRAHKAWIAIIDHVDASDYAERIEFFNEAEAYIREKREELRKEAFALKIAQLRDQWDELLHDAQENVGSGWTHVEKAIDILDSLGRDLRTAAEGIRQGGEDYDPFRGE